MSDIVDVAIMGTDPDRPKVTAHLRVDGASYFHFDTGTGYPRITGRPEVNALNENTSISQNPVMLTWTVGAVIRAPGR